LNLLDDSLGAFLRATVPLASTEVDIAFDAPDREWGSRVNRPTVNLYLWDVRENRSERDLGLVVQTDEDRKGHRTNQRVGPRPVLDCRYLVTAWTTEAGDEHALLGRVLGAILMNPVLAPEYCKGPLSVADSLIRLSLADGTDNSDFWSALGGQLKPGLDLVVSLTVDVAAVVEAGPPVETLVVTERLGVPPLG